MIEIFYDQVKNCDEYDYKYSKEFLYDKFLINKNPYKGFLCH